MKQLFTCIKHMAIPLCFLLFMSFTFACEDKGQDKLLLMPGNNGTSIAWLGTLSSAPSCDADHLNNAYYNSTDGISYVCNGSSWDILAQDGTNDVIGVKLSHSANQSIPDATATAITFDTIEEDTEGFYNASYSTKITIPTSGDGYYLVEGYIAYAPNTTGYRDISIYLNGTQYAINRGVATELYTKPCFITVSLYLSAGDYLELFAGHTAGTNLDIVNNSDINPYFAAHRIGE